MNKRSASVIGGVVAGAAAITAVAAVLVAPRRDNEVRADAWRQICQYRYAHRGLHDGRQAQMMGRLPKAPENSLEAFRRAHDLGYGAELDVHLTLDGRLVVIHDSELARVCGCEGTVEEHTLSELKECRLLGTKAQIPTFTEVLKLFEENYETARGSVPAAPLIVEVKSVGNNYAQLTEKVMCCLDSYDVRYCVESFDPRVVWWLRQHRPEVIRGQLAENSLSPNFDDPSLPLALRIGETALLGNVIGRPDFIAYQFCDRINPFVGLACGPLGGHLVTWTVKNEKELLISERAGAPAIFEGFVPTPESTIRR